MNQEFKSTIEKRLSYLKSCCEEDGGKPLNENSTELLWRLMNDYEFYLPSITASGDGILSLRWEASVHRKCIVSLNPDKLIYVMIDGTNKMSGETKSMKRFVGYVKSFFDFPENWIFVSKKSA